MSINPRSLDELENYFEQLALRPSSISQQHRQCISDRLADKSLQELHEIALQLEVLA